MKMPTLSFDPYRTLFAEAIAHFWITRQGQTTNKKIQDQGNRVAVTGGKQLDLIIALLAKMASDVGVPPSWILTKGNHLPGYFRPSKDWDLLIISPKKELLAVIELKSQVGSFGNNFNNRTEEALGSAVDLWTSWREKGLGQSQAPWLGYMMLLERTEKSTNPIKVYETHYPTRPEFQGTSYLDRYVLLCQKLILERHYTATAVVWTQSDHSFGDADASVSFETFALSYLGNLMGKQHLWN